MTHAERLYLLSILALRHKAREQAAKEGETFHAVTTYSPLSSGLEAQVEADSTPYRVRLSLRHLRGAPCDLALLDRSNRGFFDGDFDTSPTTRDAVWCYHASVGEARTPLK